MKKTLHISTVIPLLLILSFTNGSEIKTLVRNYNFTIPGVLFSTDRKTISYVMCQDKNCFVTLGTLNFSNAVYEDTCELTLKTNRSIISTINVKLLTGSKVVLDWLEKDSGNKSHLNLLTVDFPSCLTNNIEKPVLLDENESFVYEFSKNYQIFPGGGDGNFEVVYVNQDYNFMKLALGVNGNELKHVHWLPEYSYNNSLVIYPMYGYQGKSDDLVAIFHGNSTEVLVYFQDTGKIGLLEYPGNTALVASTSSRMVGLCSSGNQWRSMTCLQYDLDLKKVMESSLEFGYPVTTVVVHNMSKGGILVVSRSQLDHHGFYVRKLDSKRKYKSVKVVVHNCDWRSLHIREVFQDDDEQDGYCLTMQCQNDGDRFVVKCFSGELASVHATKSS